MSERSPVSARAARPRGAVTLERAARPLVALAVVALLAAGSACGAEPHTVPASPTAPAVGTTFPAATFTDLTGREVDLESLRTSAGAGGAAPSWLLVVFYRGYW